MSKNTVQISTRLPRRLADDLKAFAARLGLGVNGALTLLLEESLAMAGHPGIDFRFTPGGRTAFVTGTGLAVWEVWQVWNDHGRDRKKVLRNYPDLKPGQVAAAVRYAEAQPDRIARDLLRAQPDDPSEAYPFLERVRG